MYTKANLAALRVKKDIAELSRHRLNATHASTSIDFPDGTRNLLKLKVGVSMTAGLFEGATFYFMLTIPPSYPFHAPTVVCTSRAWHPSIDLHTGLVSLPILNKDWRPVLSINTVVFALQLMFIEPTEHVPVNEAAAAALKNNPELFREQVRCSLAGGVLFGVQFESHGQGVGGAANCGGPGAAQKRKRGCGDNMDTEAVQTTLEAMRIQGDESADPSSSTWDKRPRHHQQQQQQRNEPATQPPHGGLVFPPEIAAGGQQQSHQHLATFGEANALGAAVAGVGALTPQQQQLSYHQHQQQFQQQQYQQQQLLQQQQQQPVPVHSSSSNGDSTAFDRLRCHALEEAQRAAAAAASISTPAAAIPPASSVGLRCGGGVNIVGQPGIGVPPSSAGVVVGQGVGAPAVVWSGGGQYQVQAVPGTSRLQ